MVVVAYTLSEMLIHCVYSVIVECLWKLKYVHTILTGLIKDNSSIFQHIYSILYSHSIQMLCADL